MVNADIDMEWASYVLICYLKSLRGLVVFGLAEETAHHFLRTPCPVCSSPQSIKTSLSPGGRGLG
jgi:hypothetical protein